MAETGCKVVGIKCYHICLKERYKTVSATWGEFKVDV